MKVLIVSMEVWRVDQNGGNTLTWMFSGFPKDTEFAQIYCYDGMPDNDVCDNYFNITSKMVASNLLHGNKDNNIGRAYKLSELSKTLNDTKTESVNRNVSGNGIKSKIKGLSNNNTFRDFVWKYGNFRSEKLKKYILDFDPDIIYAPGYGVKYMNYLIQWIASFTNKPIATLISDDWYSFHQRKINPFFWINLLSFRRLYRNTVKLYDLIYTMTDDQKKQLEKDFNKPVKIMRKGADFSNVSIDETCPKDVIRFIHVGNLYYNRWKTLSALLDEIEKINNESGSPRFRFDIVTSYPMEDNMKAALVREGHSYIHRKITVDELKKLYKDSDIAIQAESFDFFNKIKMKMSFSTKIIEYLSSGCGIMVISDKRQSTYRYLNDNNVAICIDDESKIKDALEHLYDNQSELIELKHRVLEFGMNNHSVEKVSGELLKDFKSLL